MAYDEALAERIREIIGPRDGVSERRMFGGIAWMVRGNMAIGVANEYLMVRLDKADAAEALREPGVRPMDFTGRPLAGYVYVEADVIADAAELARWVDAGANHAMSLPAK